MQIKTFVFAGMALLGSGLSPAISGPCTAEIDALTKMLAAKDAGSGPTVGAAGQAGTPAGASAQQPSVQHPPTAVMGQETQGKATSPEDVRRQIQGQPTTAQQGMAGGSDRINQANKALERARALDGQGKEAECMDTVRQAKGLAQSD